VVHLESRLNLLHRPQAAKQQSRRRNQDESRAYEGMAYCSVCNAQHCGQH
jgi:hypothetical protein